MRAPVFRRSLSRHPRSPYSPQVHATATEAFLAGKSLLEPATVKGALAALRAEVVPEPDPELADVEYRANLTTSLLYKVRYTTPGEGRR